MRTQHRPSKSYSGPRNERGIAIVLVFLVLIVVLGLTLALTSDTTSEVVMFESSQNQIKATYGAESGLALAENQFWNAYLNAQGGTAGLMPSYLNFLDNNFAFPSINMPNEGVQGTGMALVNAQSLDGRTNLNNVEAWRNDAPSGANTTLTLRSTGQDRFGNPRVITERVRIRGGSGGLDFALLAKDMSCIFCHSEVDSAPRYYNADPARFGTYDRVKVASLSTTLLRPGHSDSNIAGTLYTRGNFLNRDANNAPMTARDMRNSNLDGYQFTNPDNYLTQTGSQGHMSQTDLIDAVPDGSGNLPAGENLYLNYPSDPAQMSDGFVPLEINPLFKDLDGDRMVDAAEVQARMDVVNSDYGYRRAGSISGGTIYNVAPGSTYNSGVLPGAGNISSVDSATNGVHTGNVILSGTEANPLILDKTVVVDGDVVIQGVVKGMGQLYASGNIYVTGDITHQQGSQFGLTADGTETGLMLKAGGNVMINDFLTPEWKQAQHADDPNYYDTGDHRAGGEWSFAQEQAALFNRLEWQKTQEYLPGSNGQQVRNSTYDPTYVPKYTTMGPGDPVYIYGARYRSGRWRGSYWDDNLGVWVGDERPSDYRISEDRNYNGRLDPGEDIDGDRRLDTGDLIMLDQAQLAAQGAATRQFTPTDGWLSDSNLKSLWVNDHATRDPNKPLTIQAGMETDSTIFVLSRNKARYGRKFDGQVLVDGMIVANNVGMLATKGLRVNYDPRLQNFDSGDGSDAPVILERLSRQY